MSHDHILLQELTPTANLPLPTEELCALHLDFCAHQRIQDPESVIEDLSIIDMGRGPVINDGVQCTVSLNELPLEIQHYCREYVEKARGTIFRSSYMVLHSTEPCGSVIRSRVNYHYHRISPHTHQVTGWWSEIETPEVGFSFEPLTKARMESQAPEGDDPCLKLSKFSGFMALNTYMWHGVKAKAGRAMYVFLNMDEKDWYYDWVQESVDADLPALWSPFSA